MIHLRCHFWLSPFFLLLLLSFWLFLSSFLLLCPLKLVVAARGFSGECCNEVLALPLSYPPFFILSFFLIPLLLPSFKKIEEGAQGGLLCKRRLRGLKLAALRALLLDSPLPDMVLGLKLLETPSFSPSITFYYLHHEGIFFTLFA